MPSSLDLTGRASEDEPNRQSRRNKRRQPRSNCTALTLNPVQSALVPYLPCPLDLYNTFTPLSLIQLPFVSLAFVLLQIPLHYNSTTANADTIHALNENDWRERVEQVSKLSHDMHRIENDVGRQRQDHKLMKRDVTDLRRRLKKLRDKREIREEWVKTHGMGGSNEQLITGEGQKERIT